MKAFIVDSSKIRQASLVLAVAIILFGHALSASAATVNITRVYPSEANNNTNATQNQWFNVTLNITCAGGNCSNINVTLDPANWYNTSWRYRKNLTLNASLISGTQTDFPVLISMVDSSLTSHALPNGTDILFTDSDGTTKLQHEIERYNSTSGTLIAWVKIPTLNSSINQTIWMYYSNSAANNQSNTTGVWTNGFIGVWHLNQDPGPGTAGDIKDSTHLTNGTAESSMTSSDLVEAKIGYGINFDGYNDQIDVNHATRWDWSTTSNITITMWIANEGHQDDSYNTLFGDATYGPQFFIEGADPSFNMAYWDGAVNENPGTTLSYATGVYYHVAVVKSGNGSIDYYRNASSAGSDTTPTLIGAATSTAAIGGGGSSPIEQFNGTIDEVRIATINRTSTWITTEYNNMQYASSFSTLGGEENNKGTISTTAGATPFWSNNSANPQQGINISSGSSQIVTFWVNASGTVNTTWDFYAYTSYNGSQANTSHWNVTITDYTPQGTVNITRIYPTEANNNTNATQNQWFNVTLNVTCTGGTCSNINVTLDPINWYNTSWHYRKNITLNQSMINGTQTEFPILVSVTDANLSSYAQSDADDILFTDSDGQTKLQHEIELYNSTTGQLIAWVKIPTLNSSTNQTVFMYYGNSEATDQSNKTGVWTDYLAVWHMNQDPGGAAPQIKDSVEITNGTTIGSMTSSQLINGQIGKALNFDGGDLINVTHPTQFDFPASNNITITLWINMSGINANNVYQFWGDTGFEASFFVDGSTNQNFTTYYMATQEFSDPLNWQANTTYYVGMAQFGTSNISFYRNGASTGTDTSISAEAANPADDFISSTGSYPYYGMIDELRIANKSRPLNWISTEYNNQNSPASFYTFGSEETAKGIISTTSGTTPFWTNSSSNPQQEINISADSSQTVTFFVNASGTANTTWDFYAYTTYNGQQANTSHWNITIQERLCNYSGSGNWDILGMDNCVINGNVNLHGNNLTVTGPGTLTLHASITNWSVRKYSTGVLVYHGS